MAYVARFNHALKNFSIIDFSELNLFSIIDFSELNLLTINPTIILLLAQSLKELN